MGTQMGGGLVQFPKRVGRNSGACCAIARNEADYAALIRATSSRKWSCWLFARLRQVHASALWSGRSSSCDHTGSASRLDAECPATLQDRRLRFSSKDRLRLRLFCLLELQFCVARKLSRDGLLKPRQRSLQHRARILFYLVRQPYLAHYQRYRLERVRECQIATTQIFV